MQGVQQQKPIHVRLRRLRHPHSREIWRGLPNGVAKLAPRSATTGARWMLGVARCRFLSLARLKLHPLLVLAKSG